MDLCVPAAFRVIVTLLSVATVEAGIGCFKCFSINGSEPACGDPFHPARGDYYKQFCRQTRTNRMGDFPAKYCTKIKGINVRTKVEMLVRSCDMDNFDNTCGTFMLEGDEYHGCLMSCKTNACNSASSIVPLGSSLWSWRTYVTGCSALCMWIVPLVTVFQTCARVFIYPVWTSAVGKILAVL